MTSSVIKIGSRLPELITRALSGDLSAIILLAVGGIAVGGELLQKNKNSNTNE